MIAFIVRKTGSIHLVLDGRLAGRQNRDQLQNVYNSLQDKLFGFLLHLIAVQCYYSVRNAFQLAFHKYSTYGVF